VATVTVALFEGLGNQMFQYAMGRALASRQGAALRLDVYRFRVYTRYKREYALHHFRIPGEVPTASGRAMFQVARVVNRVPPAGAMLRALARVRIVIESTSSPRFDRRYLEGDRGLDVYAVGYWQDERYFEGIEGEIRREFLDTGPLTPANERVSQEILGSNSVAIHVRRLLDVPTEPGAKPLADAEALGLAVRADYYEGAIQTVRASLEHPRFFVFSDFPQWSREALALPDGSVRLEPGRGPDYQDLVLMSRCKHHIIANSSFSWWAAWLARHDRQLVIAPRSAERMPAIPERWMRL
jgi:hypothetical protein